ncbi:MAG: hypothetical protein L6R48_00330 [Planctomycetes bacterium]|nr:hypothetical protein [Planctomycetota bacterium]
MRPIHALLAFATVLLCAGCSLPGGSGGGSGSAVLPSTGALTTDYNQALSDEASATSSGGSLMGRLSQAASEAVLGTAGSSTAATAAAVAPALDRAVAGSMVIDLATLKTGSRAVFPDATGTVTVTWTGTVVTSWPVGTTTVAGADLTLAFNQVVLTTASGNKLTIPSGAAAVRLEAQASVVDAGNWVLTCTTTTTVPAAAAITGNLIAGGRTTTLSLSGQRQAIWVITRTRTPDPDNAGSYLVDRRDVSVTVGGPASIGNVGGFSTWTISRGSLPVVWNRKARVSWREDLLVPVAVPPVTVSEDAIYISATIPIINATVRLGPYSIAELAAKVRLAAAEQGLLAAYL